MIKLQLVCINNWVLYENSTNEIDFFETLISIDKILLKGFD